MQWLRGKLAAHAPSKLVIYMGYLGILAGCISFAFAARLGFDLGPSKFCGTPDCNESAASHSYGLDTHCRSVIRDPPTGINL